MSPRHSSPAFTLVELLVSMAVLSLMVLAVTGMVNSVSQTTTLNRRHLEADNEARRVLDRMAIDIAKMLKRADADSNFASIKGTDSSHGANDKMFFYSEAPTYFDTTASTTQSAGTGGLIGYRVSTSNWQLERLGKGLSWDETSAATPGAVVFLTYPSALPLPAPTPTPFPASTLVGHWPTTIGTAPNYDDGVDADFHVLSNYVFRLEYCFVLKNATATQQFSVAHDQTKGFEDVAAIVVAIAVLDPQGRALIPGTATGQKPNLSKLAAALPDPDFTSSPPGKLMAELWDTKLNNGTFVTDAGVSQGVAAQVRVYQRYFYLNTPR